MDRENYNLESENEPEPDHGLSPAPQQRGDEPPGRAEAESKPEAESDSSPEHESRASSEEIELLGDRAVPQEAAMQKRKKRESRKELLEHLHRKNEMLMELDRQVKKSTQEIANKEDRLLRLAAEYENYRKRTRREWELLQKRANADLLREIVGGIDDFDRALDSLGDAEEGLRDGIKLIHTGLMDILKKAGVSEIEARGLKFDPKYHEAFGEIESEEIAEGHVAEVVRKGYMLHDEVLRPARVILSKKKTE